GGGPWGEKDPPRRRVTTRATLHLAPALVWSPGGHRRQHHSLRTARLRRRVDQTWTKPDVFTADREVQLAAMPSGVHGSLVRPTGVSTFSTTTGDSIAARAALFGPIPVAQVRDAAARTPRGPSDRK